LFDLILDLEPIDEYAAIKELLQQYQEKNRQYKKQNWKEVEEVEDTFYPLYVDGLIRNNVWLYKVEYTSPNTYILSCEEGPNCEHKKKIVVKEFQKDLGEGHYLSTISKNIYEGKVHKLTIYDNGQPHLNHRSKEELLKSFEKRTKGISKFALFLIEKLEIYLKKQIDRIEILKNLLGNEYSKHIKSSGSLSDACCHLKQVKIVKDFKNTLGDFQDLCKQYSFEKASDKKTLFVLDMNEDKEHFVLVFSCKHFLEHAILQEKSGQPSFLCIDTTFNLLRGRFKLIVVGKKSFIE